MKTILACTDFSEGSKNAVQYAAGLAASLKANLVLFHAEYQTEKPADTLAEKKKDIALNAALILTCDELKKKFGIKVKSEKSKGVPADEIIAAARRLNAGLIITGAKETAAGSGLVGGLVYDLMHASVIPVLAVPFASSFRPFEKIALAIDPNSKTKYDDQALMEFIKAFNAVLFLVTVSPPGTAAKNLKNAALTAVERQYAETMHKILAIENESLPKGIQYAVKNCAADLLTIIPRRNHYMDRMLKKTKTQKVLKGITTPLLTLPGIG